MEVTVSGPVKIEVPVYGCAITTTYRNAGKARTIVPGAVAFGGITVKVNGSEIPE